MRTLITLLGIFGFVTFAGADTPGLPTHPISGTNEKLHNQFRAQKVNLEVSSARLAIRNCNWLDFDRATVELNKLSRNAKNLTGGPTDAYLGVIK
jgi:hypothetical protein